MPGTNDYTLLFITILKDGTQRSRYTFCHGFSKWQCRVQMTMRARARARPHARDGLGDGS